MNVGNLIIDFLIISGFLKWYLPFENVDTVCADWKFLSDLDVGLECLVDNWIGLCVGWNVLVKT